MTANNADPHYDQQIAALESRQEQITLARRQASERSEKLAADYAAALVDEDPDAVSRIRAELRQAENDISAADAAAPEIVRRLADLRYKAREAALVVAKRDNATARESFLAKLRHVDTKTMTVLRDQLEPLYREVREAQAVATKAERRERDLTKEGSNREYTWMRRANEAQPGALVRMLTIEQLATTGRPLPIPEALRQPEGKPKEGPAGVLERALNDAVSRMGR